MAGNLSIPGGKEPLPEQVLLPSAGLAILRFGDACVLFDVSPLPAKIFHYHGGKNAVSIWLGGFPFVIDSACCNYDNPAFLNWYKHSCGTENAICPHSKIDINHGELFLSEATAVAACAGDSQVPMVFASGDDKTIAEIREKVPAVEYTVTKEALFPYLACSIMPAKACEQIYAGVKRAIQRPAPPAYKISGPVTVGIIDSPGHIPPFAQIGEYVTRDTFTEALTDCQKKMPWTCFDVKYPDGFVYP